MKTPAMTPAWSYATPREGFITKIKIGHPLWCLVLPPRRPWCLFPLSIILGLVPPVWFFLTIQRVKSCKVYREWYRVILG